MVIRSLSYKRIVVPLKRPLVLRTGPIREREIFLVQLETDIGTAISEAAPFAGLSTESARDVEQQLSQLQLELHGSSVEIRDNQLVFEGLPDLSNSVRFALESAAYFIHQRQNEGTQSLFPDTIHVNGLVQANDPMVMEKVQEMAHHDVKALKIKVGQLSPEKDAAVVREIASVLDTNTALRVDANRAWSVDQATVFCDAVSQLSLEYIEEPLQQLRDIVNLADRTFVPWAIDESLRLLSPEAALQLPALEAVVVKPMVLGFSTSLKLKQQALAANKQVTLSNVFTTPIGAAMELLLANGLAQWAHGYDTLNVLRSESLLLPQLVRPEKMYIRGSEIDGFMQHLLTKKW